MLEDWDRNAVFTIRGQRVTIVPSLSEMLLCVGRIPLTYTEAQFNNLVSSYGEIRRAFLMISDRTGKLFWRRESTSKDIIHSRHNVLCDGAITSMKLLHGKRKL